jgi:hypothetical protein
MVNDSSKFDVKVVNNFLNIIFRFKQILTVALKAGKQGAPGNTVLMQHFVMLAYVAVTARFQFCYAGAAQALRRRCAAWCQ